VLLDPLVLAAEIARRSDRNIPGPTLSRLAWALANHQGVALDGTTAYIVLGDPLARGKQLTLVVGEKPASQKARKARTPAQVVAAFHLACGGTEIGRQPKSGLWLPVVRGREARLTVGGCLPRPTTVAVNDYFVDWYRLDDVPHAELFYFVHLRQNWLAVYQRISPEHFALIQVQKPKNLVNMQSVVAGLTPPGKKFTGITKTGGEPTLLRKPPV